MRQFFANLTIQAKLTITFSIVLLTLVFMFYFQTSSNSNLGGIVEKMHKHPLTVTRNSTLAYAESLKIGLNVRDLQANTLQTTERDTLINSTKTSLQATRQHLAVVSDRILGKEGKQLALTTKQAFDKWASTVEQISQVEQADAQLLAQFKREEKSLSDLFVEIVAYAKVKGDGFYASSTLSIEKDSTVSIVFFIGAVLFIVVIAWLVFKSIISSLSTVRDTITDIERNSDLGGRVMLTSKCEVGAIANDFNKMMIKIEQTVVQGLNSAQSISQSNNEFTKQTNAISNSASTQSAEISHVAEIISKISQDIQTVAKNADSTNKRVIQANEVADRGDTFVKEMVKDIRGLAGSAHETSQMVSELKRDTDDIDSILEVIKAIAEQTNLLALNAAIEAARAGEQGRGFAVVADEVRNLAERTTQSTKEIQSTIEKLQVGTESVVSAINANAQKIDSSVTKAESVTEEISHIHRLMDEITVMNNDMASSTLSQAEASNNADKLIKTISILSSETKQNAMNINQQNEELLALSEKLNESMQQFKVSS